MVGTVLYTHGIKFSGTGKPTFGVATLHLCQRNHSANQSCSNHCVLGVRAGTGTAAGRRSCPDPATSRRTSGRPGPRLSTRCFPSSRPEPTWKPGCATPWPTPRVSSTPRRRRSPTMPSARPSTGPSTSITRWPCPTGTSSTEGTSPGSTPSPRQYGRKDQTGWTLIKRLLLRPTTSSRRPCFCYR